MKKPNKFFRKAACFCLVICMVLAMFPAAFADGETPADLIQADLQAQYEAELLRLKKLREEEEARKAAEAAAAAQAAAEAAAAQQTAAAQAVAQQEVQQQDASQQQSSETQDEVVPNVIPDTPAEDSTGEGEKPNEESTSESEENTQSGDNEGAGTDAQHVGNEGAGTDTQPVGTEDVSNGDQLDSNEGTRDGDSDDKPSQEPLMLTMPPNGLLTSNDGTEDVSNGKQPDGTEGTNKGTQSNGTEGVGKGSEVEDDDSTFLLQWSPTLMTTSSALAPTQSAPTSNASTGIWKAAGNLFNTVQDAINSVFNSGTGATEATVELTENCDDGNIIEVKAGQGKNVIIDLCYRTYNVLSGLVAKITGEGSVTVKNGTLVSGDGYTVVETDVADLDIESTTLVGGSDSANGALDVNGGDVDITGWSVIDAGKAANTAIDISGESDVDVDTPLPIYGKVDADGKDVTVDLQNGYYEGKVTATNGATVSVKGGNYTDDVSGYVVNDTNYAEIRNSNGYIYSAGENIYSAAQTTAKAGPTAVNILKSSGAVTLPAGVAAINSTGKVIFVNGRPVANGQTVFPGFLCECKFVCSNASIVDGAKSVWYKASEDGLTIELSSAVSYVTIDNVKADAVIDGVYAELSADTLEALTAGSHTVKFVLKNGSVAVTTVKVVPDEKVEWAEGSENGLEYEMSGNVKKVLIDHVKVAAEISGKNVSIPASILKDLKTGNHTVEFVLENTSHVVTSITVK